MSPIVTAEAAVSTWSMVVDATASPLRPIAVGRGPDPRARAVPRFDARDTVGTGDEVALALARTAGDSEPPTSTVMIVSADTAPDRFSVLDEGAGLAGLPAPTWVPDAVAEAGTVLADGRTDGPCLVIDVRADDIQAWGVRPSAAAGRVGPVEPVEIAGRVENLLIGVVRAKLGASVTHPSALPAQRSAPRSDQPDRGLRAVTGLRADVRDAARRLVAEGSQHGRTVVTVDDIEVTLESRELAEALAHAVREGAVATLGADAAGARAVVVATAAGGLVHQVAAAADAALVLERPGAALDGAIALVCPRPRSQPDPTAAPAGTAAPRPLIGHGPPVPTSIIPADRVASATPEPGPTTAAPDDRPRWVVPVLSSLVVAALAASSATALTDLVVPREPAPAAVVPADAAAPRHGHPSGLSR